jgi:hypothetical protein
MKKIQAVTIGKVGSRTFIKVYEVQPSRSGRYSWRLVDSLQPKRWWWMDCDPRAIKDAKEYAASLGLPFIPNLKQYDRFDNPLMILALEGCDD